MRTLATKQPAKDSVKQEHHKDRGRSPLAVSGVRSLYSPLSTGMPLLQRKCACGGSCPRCQSALLQTKLKISEPSDRYEQEADHIADQIMRMPDSTVQRQAVPEEEEMIQRKAAFNQAAPSASTQESSDVLSIVHEVLNSSGQPLDLTTRTFMESRFGNDFSHVRIHTDETASRTAQDVKALAYTTGSHIVFGVGQYSPQTTSGKRLIAHELVHTMQQSSIASAPILQRQLKIPIFDEFDPCITVEDQQLCGSDAKKACEKLPFLPGCGAVCKTFGCEKPAKPDTSCPPGFRVATSSDFKGQCCRGSVDSIQNCCPPSRAALKDLRCCKGDEVVSEGQCVKPPDLPPLPPVSFCLPEQKTQSGQCCILPLIPLVNKCVQPPPPSPPPSPLPTAAELFFKLDKPALGTSLEASLSPNLTSKGQQNFEVLVKQLQVDPQLRVQLVGRASPEGSEAYNLALGRRRAELVAHALEREGIVSSRIADPPGQELRSECEPIRAGVFTCGEAGATGDADRQVMARIFRAITPP
jgi:Domain of unknown function (DUF4157)/OmpA family